MAWKPKTVFGKILKGATIGVVAAGAAVGGAALIAGTGGAAAPAVVTAGGGLLSKVLKGTKKVVDVVGTKAKDLVSGVTADQRVLIQEQRQENRADVQKLNTIEKLVNLGSTVEAAAAKVGVPISELKGSFGIPSDADKQAAAVVTAAKEPVETGTKKYIMYAGLGLAALFLLPSLLKHRR